MDKTKAVINDMHTSMTYLKSAEPIILDLLKGGEMLPVEGSDDEICKMLDLTCGIDYFHIYRENGLTWGVASRFQLIKDGYKPFNTFTIRKERESGTKTEYEKRLLAIEKNGEYPYLTLQGYYNENGEVLSIGIARTKDIFEMIDKGCCETRETGKQQIGQATFFVISWDNMKEEGYTVLTT